MTRTIVCLLILTSLISLKSSAQADSSHRHPVLPQSRLLPVLPQNFYNQHKGYVCRKEDQLQKATRLNLVIRLGSKAYVDYLERKPNALKP